jgi:Fuc2NAc and GlcNAc transferase
MTPLGMSGLVAVVAVGSWGLTRVFRGYALTHGMLDVPGERSSHIQPTPRGGGAAIALTTLAGLGWLALTDVMEWNVAVGFWIAGGVVAIVGFLDDRGHVGRGWRLLAHFGAAVVVLVSLGGTRPITVLDQAMGAWVTWPLALLYIVWIINLTNFMDGIDGLAASEAVTVASGAALLYAIAGWPADASIVPLVLAAAAAGFLIWNRPPAAVFMGDVGSGFVGLSLAAMSLHASMASASLFCAWLILLGVFVVDASITLIRRALRAERVYEGHRSHAYQHAAARWRTHGGITLAVVAINLLWLLPLACLVALHRIDPITGVVVAYAPLAAAATRLGAGMPASPWTRHRPRGDSPPVRR